MDPGVICLALCAATVILVLAMMAMTFNHTAMVQRAVTDAKPTTLRDGPERVTVRLRGTVLRALGTPLTAPLSGSTCVAFATKVFEHSEVNDNPILTKLASEESIVAFEFDDGTGKVEVVAEHAIVATLPAPHRGLPPNVPEPTRELEAFLRKHGRTAFGWIFPKMLSTMEETLHVGQPIDVVGRIVRRTAQDGTTVLRLVPPLDGLRKIILKRTIQV